MRQRSSVLLIAAALLVVAGCGRDSHPEATPPSAPPPPPAVMTTATLPAPPADAPLPAPEALTDVLAKLADPAIPGDQKLNLVESPKPDEATVLDRFGKALQDSGSVPLSFTASNLAWSPDLKGYVRADIAAQSPNPALNFQGFVMDFKPVADGWQLSRRTADSLLVYQGPQPTG